MTNFASIHLASINIHDVFDNPQCFGAQNQRISSFISKQNFVSMVVNGPGNCQSLLNDVNSITLGVLKLLVLEESVDPIGKIPLKIRSSDSQRRSHPDSSDKRAVFEEVINTFPFMATERTST
ncbi:uncharacterized protein G2W53_017733 [Senna tora]|uniref:Uncharacterized protein n=1 Tax=Senna tora TaxID=362788 RepID=A0A834TRR9_9FABA|nr:uncharacterized protein G2W53_017733 [Senna tora]